MGIWVALAIGIVVGIAISWIFRKFQTTYGTLRIDHSDPNKDIYRIEIDDLDKLSSKSDVRLKIDHNANLSQK